MLDGKIKYGALTVYASMKKEGSEYIAVLSGNKELFDNAERGNYYKLKRQKEDILFSLTKQKYALQQVTYEDAIQTIDYKELLKKPNLKKAEEMFTEKVITEETYTRYKEYVQLILLYNQIVKQIKAYSKEDKTNYNSGSLKTRDYYLRIDFLNSKYYTDIQNIEFVEKFISCFMYGFSVRQAIDEDRLQEYVHYKVLGADNIAGLTIPNWETKGVMTYRFDRLVNYRMSTSYISLELNYAEENREVRKAQNLYAKGKLPVKKYTKNRYEITEDVLGFKMYNKILYGEETTSGGYADFYTSVEDVNAAHPEKKYEWLKAQKYHIVSDETLPKLLNRWDRALKERTPIGLDTETTGLQINILSRDGLADDCVGFSIAFDEGESYYVPLQMRSIKNMNNNNHVEFMHNLKTYFEDGKAQYVLHNVPFDWRVFYRYGIKLHYIADTMLIQGVTYRYRYGKSYTIGLKPSCQRIFGLDMYSLKDFTKSGKWGGTEEKEDGSCFADLPYEFVRLYATTDADITLRFYNYFKKICLIEEYEAEEVLKIETLFAEAAAYSQFHGIHINISELPKLVEKIELAMKECHKKVIAEAHKLNAFNFTNPNASAQIAEVLYDYLKLDPNANPGKQKGKRGTDSSVLSLYEDILNEDDTPKYPFIVALKEYKEYSQIYSDFVNKRYSMINTGGLVFSDLSSLGTETGRTTVKNPNYQSFNDAIKDYVSPRENYLCFDCDYSQIELRVMFSMARQLNLIEQANDPTADLHTLKACVIFNVPYEMVTPKMRKVSKKFNFGVPYGMSLGTMAEQLGLTMAEATERYEAYFSDMPLVRKMFAEVKEQGLSHAYTSTLYNRRRYYPLAIKAKETGVPLTNRDSKKVKRLAGNHVIQGTAADIWKIAVVRLMKMIRKNDWWDKFLMDAFIHDEVYGEVDESVDYNDFIKQWHESFEVEVPDFCKLFAGCGMGNTWVEAKHMDLPPLYIQELIKDGKTMEWENNAQAYRQYLIDHFVMFKENTVKEYLLNEANANKVIHPVTYEFLKEVVDFSKYTDKEKEEKLYIKTDYELYWGYIQKELKGCYGKGETELQALEQKLPEIHQYFSELYAEKQSVKEMTLKLSEYFKSIHCPQKFYVSFNLKKATRSLQDYLKVFCYEHGIVYTDITILSSEDKKRQIDEQKKEREKTVGVSETGKSIMSETEITRELDKIDRRAVLAECLTNGYSIAIYSESGTEMSKNSTVKMYLTEEKLLEIIKTTNAFSNHLNESAVLWNTFVSSDIVKNYNIESTEKQAEISYIDFIENQYIANTKFEEELQYKLRVVQTTKESLLGVYDAYCIDTIETDLSMKGLETKLKLKRTCLSQKLQSLIAKLCVEK